MCFIRYCALAQHYNKHLTVNLIHCNAYSFSKLLTAYCFFSLEKAYSVETAIK